MDISLGTKGSRARRIALRVLLIGLVTIGSVLVPTSGQAREAAPATPLSTSYASPLDALGGLTLAQYLADHQARVLGPVGV
jgi:hypothetical protein